MSLRMQASWTQSILEAHHARVAQRLAEYATLQANGREPGHEWRDLEDHLRQCSICQEDLAELRSTLQDLAAGWLPPAERYAVPDLSFLSEVGQAVGDGSADLKTLTQVVRNAFVQFSDALVARLQLPQLAGNLRGDHSGTADSPGRPIASSGWSYRAPHAAENELSIVIEVEPSRAAQQGCRVLVTVDDPADPIPQIESEVTLQYQHVIHTYATDRGTVAFSNVPIDAVAHMRITVAKNTPAG